MLEIDVNIANHPYQILVEPGIVGRVGTIIRKANRAEKCLLVVDLNIVKTHAPQAQQSLADAGFEVATASLVAKEQHKSLESVANLYQQMLHAKLHRGSPVIALGGGIVGDVAGFAAATFMRGVPLVQVPTTLLAMVDAAIGGKTGVNVPLPQSSDLGKNLVGAFWQPLVVIIDPDVLQTLPARETRCGLAECIKHALIADASLLEFISQNVERIMQCERAALVELVSRSASIKSQIVASDERESGPRALLNLGHTFGHAMESVAELNLHHGEAVAIGLAAATFVTQSRGGITSTQAVQITDVLTRCGLPLRLPLPVAIDRLMNAMAFDKKAVAGRLTLILPRGIGRAEIANDVTTSLVREAWQHVGARA